MMMTTIYVRFHSILLSQWYLRILFWLLHYVKRVYKYGYELKTDVELIWFEIIPCASFYSVLRSIPEVSRMFQRNLEYTSICYNKT